jgi:class 3 adenylate cyclase/pimeloyl-ACP methyl ester carboxylesterase
VQPPEVQYARRPDGLNIAYQVVGDEPIDLIMSPGFVSHLDLFWSDPGYVRLVERLSSFARLILYDKLGTGLSDPIRHLPAIEERVDDMRLLLDRAGSEHAAIFGISEGGPAAALFAASYPDRTRALAIYGSFAAIDPVTAEQGRRRMDDMLEHWGDGGRIADFFVPSATALQRRFMGTFARAAASPSMARAVIDVVFTIDVSDALPLIQAPTLVMHRDEDRAIPAAAGRDLAGKIAGAKFVLLRGIDHVPWAGDIDAVADELASFLTGSRAVRAPDRALATVLFTDIVSSTETAARLGDSEWRELLERHDSITQREVESCGGRVVKSLGDGALAVFDGPARAVRCARALTEEVSGLGIALRAGVHTGEVELIGEDVGGMAVHLGSRVSAKATAGEVLVSSTVRDLVVGSELRFADAGAHELKGVPGEWRLFRLAPDDAPVPVLDSAERHMKRRDRAAVTIARRAPSAARLVGRLAAGRKSPHRSSRAAEPV